MIFLEALLEKTFLAPHSLVHGWRSPQVSGITKLKSGGDKLYEVHYSAKIMAADMCEINNNLSLVKQIIEHILKRYKTSKRVASDEMLHITCYMLQVAI